nr:cation efflux protein, CzcI family [uncultured Roseateles sp.]
MRRCVLVLMLLVLPFQFSWAAAAAYCRHEGGVAVQHFGHHQHEHGSQGKADDGAKSLKNKASTIVDDDCSICHLSTVPSPVSEHVTFEVPLVETAGFVYSLRYDSYVPLGLERPDRNLAA